MEVDELSGASQLGCAQREVPLASDFRILNAIFDIHVLELAGLEDFPTFLALHEFRLFIAAYDLNTRMLARWLGIHVRRRGGRLGGHVIRMVPSVALPERGSYCAGILGIVERLYGLSSPLLSFCQDS